MNSTDYDAPEPRAGLAVGWWILIGFALFTFGVVIGSAVGITAAVAALMPQLKL